MSLPLYQELEWNVWVQVHLPEIWLLCRSSRKERPGKMRNNFHFFHHSTQRETDSKGISSGTVFGSSKIDCLTWNRKDLSTISPREMCKLISEEQCLPNFLDNKGIPEDISDFMHNVKIKLAGLDPMKNFEDPNLMKGAKVSKALAEVADRHNTGLNPTRCSTYLCDERDL